MNRHWILALRALCAPLCGALLLGPLACDDTPAGSGSKGRGGPSEACVTQDDCNGADCINGVCTEQPCMTQEDCNGADCVNGFCSLHPCRSQGECVLGGDCVNGLCIDADAGIDADDTSSSEDGSGDDDDADVPGDALDDTPDVTPDVEEGALFGEACVDHVECASGLCVDTAQARVCTDRCDGGECPHEGFECLLLEDVDQQRQQLCMPSDSLLCQTCKDDTECGSDEALCVNFADGLACATPCGPNGLCPIGFRCEQQLRQSRTLAVCLPTSGACGGCDDQDGDGYGVGARCLGFDCDDRDPESHQDANEVCDGRDNDCDEVIDEGFPQNVCGGCAPLDDIPGNPCGPCGLDALVCDGGNLRCDAATACPAPTTVTASDGTRVDAVEVRWTGPAAADAYRIFRDEVLIGEVDGDVLAWDDLGAAPGGLPGAPTSLAASDGTFPDRVELSWVAPGVEPGPAHLYTVVAVFGVYVSEPASPDSGFRAGAPITRYEVSVDGATWTRAGVDPRWADASAPAPQINAGAAVASDGTSFTAVELDLDGAEAIPGAVVSYQARAVSAAGEGAASSADTGYRGVGALSIQWERSAGDAESGWSDLAGAATARHDDTTAPADGAGRYYRARLTTPGASPTTSSADRGYRAVAECGNGTPEPGEECDDRNRLSNDGCDSSCRREFCGDGVVQDGLGEVCDDRLNDGRYDGCEAGCRARGPYCGDGNTDPVEGCDDGNRIDDDACSNACTRNATLVDCGPVAVTSNGLLGDVTLTGAAVFDTDAGTLVDGAITVAEPGHPGVSFATQPAIGPFSAPGIAVFHFATLTIPANVTVRVVGRRALALLATGDLSVAGTIDAAGLAGGGGATNAAGSAGTPGAGGWAGGAFVSGPGCAAGNGLADGPGRGNEGGCGTRGGDGADASGSGGGGGGGGSCGGSGGAGAGFSTAGGDGADGSAGAAGDLGAGTSADGGSACQSPPPGSRGGPAIGDPELSILLGGSGGSSGGFGALGGFGGDGGDTGTGWGGAGGAGGQSGGGGGGGGGGGALLLCAEGQLIIAGTLDVHGGSGGGGGGSDIAMTGGNASVTGSDPRGGGGGAGRSGGGGGGGGGAGGAILLRAPAVQLLNTARLLARGGTGGFAGFSGGGGFGGTGASGGGRGGRGGDGGRGGRGGDGSDGYLRVESDSLLNSAILDGSFVAGGL